MRCCVTARVGQVGKRFPSDGRETQEADVESALEVAEARNVTRREHADHAIIMLDVEGRLLRRVQVVGMVGRVDRTAGPPV